MTGYWWRAYDEAVDDPKLQLMPPPLFKSWFNLLCLASANGGKLPNVEVISFKLRIPVDKVRHLVAELAARNLLDQVDGCFVPHNWRGRQFKTDVTDPTVTGRMRKYRNQKRNATVTDTVTNSVTEPVTVTFTREQSTETEVNAKAFTPAIENQPPKRGRKPNPRQRLSERWHLDKPDIEFARGKGWKDNKIAAEEQRFADHARAHNRLQADWHAAWRNWVTSPFQQKGQPNGNSTELSVGERAKQLADDWRRGEREAGLFEPPDDAGSHRGGGEND